MGLHAAVDLTSVLAENAVMVLPREAADDIKSLVCSSLALVVGISISHVIMSAAGWITTILFFVLLLERQVAIAAVPAVVLATAAAHVVEVEASEQEVCC